jgi:CheY-like chemotaxis protein
MHGGTVEAESAGPGQGSRFTIRLPMPLAAVAQPLPRAARASRPVPHRILVVEDNVDSAEAMLLLLRQSGHEVMTVNDGAEAVGVARVFRPDVILLDIGLPGMDGYELAGKLRGMAETRDARMIAVSGYGQQKDRQRSTDAGFDLHLVKPVDPSRLREAIDAAGG